MDKAMGNQQATEAEIGWLAGIVDGEGHIGLSKQNTKKCRNVRPDMQIVNTDPDLIKKVVEVLRKVGVNPYVRERTHDRKTWANNLIVTVGRFAGMDRVFLAIRPHLTGAKAAKAELIHELIKRRIKKGRFEHYDAIELGIVDEWDRRFGKGAPTTTRQGPAPYLLDKI
jgi:hypothetical protein